MPKLFLVGITPDHRALVLSEHARAKRGDMVLEIDDRLLEAIDKAQRLRAFDEGNRLESAALPSKRDVTNGDGTDVARLTPREIQQRLRAGETITALARSSGTDEAWIRRFAAPVLAEQAKVIEGARGTTFTKRGVGPSAVTLGPAVAANVIDRGVPLTLPELEAGWGAYQRPEGGWHVTFTFPLRGRRQTAEWEVDLGTGELTARNKLASELGWRETGKKLPQPKPAKVTPPRPADVATRPPAPSPEPAAGRPEPESAQVLPLTDEGSTGEAAGKPPSARKLPAVARKAPAARTTARKSAAAAKRTAAAVTEAPAQSVVPVSPSDASADADAGADVAPGSRADAGAAPGLPADAGAAPGSRADAGAAPGSPADAGAAPGSPADAGADARAEAAREPERPAGSMPPTDLDVVDVPGGFPLPDDDADEPETVIVLPPSDDEIPEPPRAADDDGPTGPISMVARPQPAPLGARPVPRSGRPAL